MKMVKVDGEFCKDHERGIARSTNLEKREKNGNKSKSSDDRLDKRRLLASDRKTERDESTWSHWKFTAVFDI